MGLSAGSSQAAVPDCAVTALARPARAIAPPSRRRDDAPRALPARTSHLFCIPARMFKSPASCSDITAGSVDAAGGPSGRGLQPLTSQRDLAPAARSAADLAG